MDDSNRARSLRLLLLFAAAYLAIGFVTAWFSDRAATHAMLLMWRRLAWVLSGLGFAAHIVWGLLRLGNSPRAAAMHAAIGAALAAGGLACMANVHELTTASRYRPAMAIALVAWPLLTAVPAFLVAIVAATVLDRWRRRW